MTVTDTRTTTHIDPPKILKDPNVHVTVDRANTIPVPLQPVLPKVEYLDIPEV